MEPFVQSTEINTYDFVLSKEQHVPAIIEQNNLLFRKSATALEQYLSVNEYLIDSHFTAADIVMAYTLCWGQEQQLLSEFPYINQYMDRLYARKDCTLTKP
jgi:glutathione S-transferase